jgi:hypothetical protein
MNDLPTPASYGNSGWCLTVWCKACRYQTDVEFPALVKAGKGNIPLVNLRFRCTNCRSLLTDFVVSGSHMQPGWRSVVPNQQSNKPD